MLRQLFNWKTWAVFYSGFAGYLLYRQGKQRYKSAQFSYLYENLNMNLELKQDYIKRPPKQYNGIIAKTIDFFRVQLRVLELIVKFTPLLLFFPFALLFRKSLFQHWVWFLIKTLESAGPLWMKLGQWASHRGDVFGYEITKGLSRLRDSSTPHKYAATKEQFEKEFNSKVEDVFDTFEKEPYASGSIGQIHIAVKDGKKYAVKVRHPKIIEKLELDLKILYNISNFLSSAGGFFGRLAMPVTFNEFSNTLMNQADFRFEGSNLELFNENFKDSRNIIFPKVFTPYVSKSVLVESFEEGVSLTDFMKTPKTREHKIAANLGLKAFYKMLMYDNFIHADLHAGNILVRISENTDSKWEQYYHDLQDSFYDWVENVAGKVLPYFEKQFLNRSVNILQNEQKNDEVDFWQYIREVNSSRKRLDLVYIDPGMVTILNNHDRIAFIKIIMYVALRQPKECGNLMLSLAQYDKQIKEEKKTKFLQDIDDLFKGVCSVPLAQMNMGVIFKGMLDILRNNELAIEGHFATLLTNMMILEGIGRDLDSNLNVVSKAASFLLQIRTIDSTINDLMSVTL